MKRWIHASTNVHDTSWFEKVRPISAKWLEWAGTDNPEYAAERLEDNGYAVFNTIKDCCDQIFDFCDGDIQEALGQIDIARGNSVGALPLADYDWREQQSIFLEYIGLYHPELATS